MTSILDLHRELIQRGLTDDEAIDELAEGLGESPAEVGFKLSLLDGTLKGDVIEVGPGDDGPEGIDIPFTEE